MDGLGRGTLSPAQSLKPLSDGMNEKGKHQQPKSGWDSVPTAGGCNQVTSARKHLHAWSTAEQSKDETMVKTWHGLSEVTVSAHALVEVNKCRAYDTLFPSSAQYAGFVRRAHKH